MACTPVVPDKRATPAVLRIRSLSKSFARGPSANPVCTAALIDVSLDLANGEVLGVVGAAGSGKTTLLQCAAGMMRRDHGSIEWFGEQFAGGGCLPDLAYVPAMPVYYPFLTVRDVLEYSIARDHLPPGRRNDSIASALARTELDEAAAAYVCDLPREAVKRLALAEALAAEPRVIFVDSVSSDIALPCGPVVLRALAGEAARGRAIVVAVRDAGMVAPIASRIVLLEKGRNAGTFSNDETRHYRDFGDSSFTTVPYGARFVAERLH